MAGISQEENLRAKLNLFAILPLLEILAELDPKAKKWAGRIKSPIVIKIADIPEMTVCISGNSTGLKVERKSDSDGVIAEFPSPQSLNAFFEGEKALPKVRGLFKQPISVISFGFLIKRMAEIMTNKDESSELRANLIINAIAGFFEVLGNSDPSFASVLDKKNAMIAWEIKPAGPAAGVAIENGEWRYYRGRAANYTVAIEFSGIEAFMDLIEGRDTARMAFFMGNIKPCGDAMLAMKVGFLMEEAQKYFNPL